MGMMGPVAAMAVRATATVGGGHATEARRWQ